ncbi:MAG TPA: carboxypeptidase-like regulatory domain-containing protein [Solirubrobacteraceae bacterium]|nr:carboxypeptidase-like regulatory domain-containing protein [Solirubrobacteraceae bacterium]
MLSIQVRDSQGLEIPEARLTVATLGTPSGGVEPTLQQQATSTAGHGAFELAPGFYTVTASMIGFVPRVVPIEVTPGCSGKRLIVLPVASTERLQELVQRSQSERP